MLSLVSVDEKVSLQVTRNLLAAESTLCFGLRRQSHLGYHLSSMYNVDECTRHINASPNVEKQAQAVYD